MPICLRLFLHCVLAAASRTFCTAGTSRLMRIAMMAITTSSSINVKPERDGLRDTAGPPKSEEKVMSNGGIEQVAFWRPRTLTASEAPGRGRGFPYRRERTVGHVP